MVFNFTTGNKNKFAERGVIFGTGLLVIFTIVTVLLLSGCAGKIAPSANRIEGSIISGGLTRTYRLFVPAKYYDAEKSVPLLIALHGGGGSGQDMEEKTTRRGFDKLAERDNVIVAYPDAIEKNWNDGRGNQDLYAVAHNVDDVGFINELIEHLAGQYRITRDRVAVTGISNGGMMSFRLGCELSDKLASVATVAAALPAKLSDKCKPTRKIPHLMIHGLADPIIPWDGGPVRLVGKAKGRVISVPKTFELLAQINNCQISTQKKSLPDRDPTDGTHVWRQECRGGSGGTDNVLLGVEGGGHTWPGEIRRWPESLVGKMSQDIDATQIIWDFML